MEHPSNELVFKNLGIYTQHDNYAYMREDCPVCISEGFEALTRIRISNGKKSINLNIIRSNNLTQAYNKLRND